MFDPSNLEPICRACHIAEQEPERRRAWRMLLERL